MLNKLRKNIVIFYKKYYTYQNIGLEANLPKSRKTKCCTAKINFKSSLICKIKRADLL